MYYKIKKNDAIEYPKNKRIFNTVSAIIEFNRTIIKIIEIPNEIQDCRIHGYLKNNSDSLILSNSDEFYISFTIISVSATAKKIAAAFTKKKYIDKIINDAANEKIFFDYIETQEMLAINYINSNYKDKDFILIISDENAVFVSLTMGGKIIYIRTIDIVKSNIVTELNKTLEYIKKTFSIPAITIYTNVVLSGIQADKYNYKVEHINNLDEKIYKIKKKQQDAIFLNLMPSENPHNYQNLKKNIFTKTIIVLFFAILSIFFLISISSLNNKITDYDFAVKKNNKYITENTQEYNGLLSKEKIIKANTKNNDNLLLNKKSANYIYLNIISNSIQDNMRIISIERGFTESLTESYESNKYSGYSSKSKSVFTPAALKIKGISASEKSLIKYAETLDKSGIFRVVQIESATKNAEGFYDFVLNIKGKID